MKIHFKCPNCQAKYSASSEQIGKKGTCKKCGAELTVPTAKANYKDVESVDDDFITSYASQIGGQAFAAVFEIIKQWRDEFQILLKKQVPQPAIDIMILESTYLAHFIALEKSENILDENAQDLFRSYLREAMVVALTAYYDSPQKETDLQAHHKLIEQFYDNFLQDRMSAYESPDISTIELFRVFLTQNAFNNNNVGLKFMEMTFVNKLRIKFSQFLFSLSGNSESDLAAATYLNVSLLDSVITNIGNALMNIDAAAIQSQCKS